MAFLHALVIEGPSRTVILVIVPQTKRVLRFDLGTAAFDIAELRRQLPRAVREAALGIERVDENAFLAQLLQRWGPYNWSASAVYHGFCYDYPFLENTAEGLSESRERMVGYAAAEPDTLRFKSYAHAAAERRLASVADSLVSVRDGNSALDRLLAACSASFLETAQLVAPWQGSKLVFRVSPSGGGRHPTEAYFLNLTFDGLAPGWHHVDVGNKSLRRLAGPDRGEAHWARLFPRHHDDCPFAPRGQFVFTTVFYKNMYRYREARTYRSLFMDVGHLAETAEFFLEAGGFQTYAHVGMDEELVARALGLVTLEECPQFAITVG